MPGPLSVTVMRNLVAWLGATGSPFETTSSLTVTSGRMPASSHASSALSTASFTQVRSALRGLSKPSRCRFFVKNSATEISRWRAPISTAVTCCDGFAGAFAGGVDSGTDGTDDLGLETGADAFFFAIHPLKNDLVVSWYHKRGTDANLLVEVPAPRMILSCDDKIGY